MRDYNAFGQVSVYRKRTHGTEATEDSHADDHDCVDF